MCLCPPATHPQISCSASFPECTNNTKWSEGVVAVSYIPIHAENLVISEWVSCLCSVYQSLKWRQCINVRLVKFYCIYKSSSPHPFSHFSLPPKRIHMLATLHTHTHVRAWCSWVTGSGINVIPCWWLKSVDNRDVSKGDQSRLAQDTAGGLVGFTVINTGCYLGVGTLTSPHWGNTGSPISME